MNAQAPPASAEAPDNGSSPPSAFPSGLGKAELKPARLWRRLDWLPIVIIGAVVLAGLSGLTGGGPAVRLHRDSPMAGLDIKTPRTVHNGVFVETVLAITAHRPIADAVVWVSAPLWRDITVNTMIPQADKEEYRKGRFLFHYGKLAPGEVLAVKIDGQINPPLFMGTSGSIGVDDGGAAGTAAAGPSLPVGFRVWP